MTIIPFEITGGLRAFTTTFNTLSDKPLMTHLTSGNRPVITGSQAKGYKRRALLYEQKNIVNRPCKVKSICEKNNDMIRFDSYLTCPYIHSRL